MAVIDPVTGRECPRARFDARIYTNDAASLARNLGRQMGKSAAIDLSQGNEPPTVAWGHRLSL